MKLAGGQGDDFLGDVDAMIDGRVTIQPKRKKGEGGGDGLLQNLRDMILGKNPNDPVNQPMGGTKPPAADTGPTKPTPPQEVNVSVPHADTQHEKAQEDGKKGLLETLGKFFGFGG